MEAIRASLHDDAALGDPLQGLLAAAGLLVGATAVAVWAMRSRMRNT